MFKLSVVILLFSAINTIESARILGVFPIPSISHQVVFRSLTAELAKRGHELTVITPDPMYKKDEAPANFTEIDVHDVAYKAWNEMLDYQAGAPLHKLLTSSLSMMVDVIKVQMETPQLKVFMEKEQKFDLVIAEACVPATLGFANKFKAPVIQMSSLYGMTINFETMGAPSHMFLYPDVYRNKFRNLTVLDKIVEVFIEVVLKAAYHTFYVSEVDTTLKKYFGRDTPTLYELEQNIEMLFINSNPVWEGSRPVPPSVVHLGGLHMKPAKELPKDLKSYLDASKGVIYVSFGTNFSPSTLSEERIRMLFSVFFKLPYDILMKWDTDFVSEKPSNVKIFKWLPQNDLLRHPNVKLFITQGGMQSTDEAITAGVPLIGIPIKWDQFYNTEKYLEHKIGEKLSLDRLTEEQFSETINKVLGDDSYRQNMIKLRNLMDDQQTRPLERAVWWTEHVLRHGGARHLRAPAANMPWHQYIELELVAALLVILIVILSIFVGFLYLFARFMQKILSRTKLNTFNLTRISEIILVRISKCNFVKFKTMYVKRSLSVVLICYLFSLKF